MTTEASRPVGAGDGGESPTARRSPVVAALVLSSIALYAAFLVVRSAKVAMACAIGGAVVAVGSAVLREPRAMHATLLIALLMGWIASNAPLAWPLYLAIPLAAYAFAVRTVRPLRRTLAWWRLGRIDRITVGLMLGAVLVSSTALYVWLKWTHPYLGDLRGQLPDVGTLALLGTGLAFAIGNAVLEECVWRGVLLEALDAGLGRGATSVVIQALSFGAAHIAGFPRGAWGVAMAAVYGLMLGAIRRRSSGMLAPIVTHVFADATIFALLLRFA